MKHTPGPWKVQQVDNQSYARTIVGDGFWIADVAHAATGDNESAANARLTAAAPEMLDMLQTINAYFYEYRNGELSGYEHELAGQISATIKKAT